ncbi:helix-turn-helix domain-containing protein [Acetobacter okinawensis]|uniref:helix-turn-helix domain-containing protein n=1 Tax=Acetobacter okinawensis TaxID=1076594 RepID=UPI000A3A29C1|nr:helix-turn-helix transcriptional regulator [Acetobacter okinawensis]
MSIGSRLRTLRERATMGQAEVAAVLDVSIPTISEWENGKKRPRRDRVIALARLFDVSTDFLLHGTVLTRPDQGENEEEDSLISLYRSADPQVRIAVMTLLRAASSSNQ